MKKFLPQKIIFWLALACSFILLLLTYALFTQRASQKAFKAPKQPEIFQGAPAPANHPDINIDVRGYESISGYLGLLNYHPIGSGLIDPSAPQLSTLIENNARPAVVALYQMYQWDWNTNQRGNLIRREDYGDPTLPQDLATLIALATNSGDKILVPDSEYDIGGGYEVMVLYATADSITIKYTREDNMAYGYGIHLKNFNVDPEVLSLYNTLHAAGRQELPILCGGQKLGTANGSPILVAIRDTGAFLDPRWENDWWFKPAATENTTCELTSTQAISAAEPEEEVFTVKGPSMGFFDAKIEDENKSTREEPLATPEPTPQGEVEGISFYKKENPEGEVHYEKIVFPNFKALSKNMDFTTRAVVPDQIKPSLSGKPVAKIYTEVYPYEPGEEGGEDFGSVNHEAAATCEEAAKHEKELANLTEAALGPVAIYGPHSPENQIANLTPYENQNFKFKVEEVDYSCSAGFAGGDKTIKEDLAQLEEVKPNFVLGFISVLKNVIEEILELILKITTKEKTQYKMAFKAHIPTVNASAQYAAKVAKTLIPQNNYSDWLPKDEAKALIAGSSSNGTKARVRVNGFEGGTESQVHYGDLATLRNMMAAGICTAYSEEAVEKRMDVYGHFGKMFPSCDPEDYKADEMGEPRNPCIERDANGNPILDADGNPIVIEGKNPQECVPPYCTWIPAYSACQYGVWCNPDNNALPGGADYNVNPGACGGSPQIEPGCEFGKDPICESCLGLPYGLVIAQHMNWCGGNPPRECNCSRCKWIQPTNRALDEYSDSRFNGCYYAGPTCVQTNPADQSFGNICSYGCSPDCCQFCD